MNNTYTDLVKQTFNFPQEGFEVKDDGYLQFNGLDLKALDRQVWYAVETYLPAQNRYADQQGKKDVCQCY